MVKEICITLPTSAEFYCGLPTVDPKKKCKKISIESQTYKFKTLKCSDHKDCSSLSNGTFGCSHLGEDTYTFIPVTNDLQREWKEYLKSQVAPVVKLQSTSNMFSADEGICLPYATKPMRATFTYNEDERLDPSIINMDSMYAPSPFNQKDQRMRR